MFLLLGHASNRGVFNPRLKLRRSTLSFAPYLCLILLNGALCIVFCRPISYFSGAINKSRFHCGQNMSVEAMVQTMIDDLTAALADAVKHDKGNAAAGTRVRKAMQDAKSAAQAVRTQVQADKNA
jgi:hypothetical protein